LRGIAKKCKPSNISTVFAHLHCRIYPKTGEFANKSNFKKWRKIKSEHNYYFIIVGGKWHKNIRSELSFWDKISLFHSWIMIWDEMCDGIWIICASKILVKFQTKKSENIIQLSKKVINLISMKKKTFHRTPISGFLLVNSRFKCCVCQESVMWYDAWQRHITWVKP
jgi:hypothetical protein